MNNINNEVTKLSLRGVNHALNHSRPEARQLMDFSIDLPDEAYSTPTYSMIQPIFNEQLNRYLYSKGLDLHVSNDMQGIVFDKSSPLSQKLSNLKQLQNDIRKKLSENPNAKYIDDLGIDTDTNLQYSVGHYTIINPHVDNGVFKGILIDKYDFDWKKIEELDSFKTLIVNNFAYLFQLFQLLQNYYVLVPIEFKL